MLKRFSVVLSLACLLTPALRGQSPPQYRPEAGFAFSRQVYDFLLADYADPEDVRRQARLLFRAGVRSVQLYLLRWSEVLLVRDGDGRIVARPSPLHDRINDAIVEILSEEGLKIHVEFFSHHPGLFESRKKNPDSLFSINVPAHQAPPLPRIFVAGLLPQFQEYVFDTVRRYPQIRSWGFLNEVDAWDVDDLVSLQNAYFEAVKAANPEALVGAASPTFPEVLAPAGDLHAAVFERLGYYFNQQGEVRRDPERNRAPWLADQWKAYPSIYEGWKTFYSEARFDFVQLHQLGVRAWTPEGWAGDNGYDARGAFLRERSTRWQLVRKGVENVHSLAPEVPVTSQVDIDTGTDLPVGGREYWRRVQQNFVEAASGGYGYHFLDTYQLRENFARLADGTWWRVTRNPIFTVDISPTPLYLTVADLHRSSGFSWRRRR